MLRTRVGPWAIWLATMGGALWLWQDLAAHPTVVGFAKGTEYRLGPPVDARVRSLAVELGQQVSAGQVVATLDTTDVDAELAVLRARRAEVQARIEQARMRASLERAALVQRLDESVEAAEAALAKAKAGGRVARAELKALGEQRAELEALVAKQLTRRDAGGDLAVREAAARQEAGAARSTVAVLEGHVKAAKARREALPEDTVERSVAPLVAEREVVERELARAEARREALVIRAPAAGSVAQVLWREGAVVRAGDPVVRLVGAPEDRVVACVSEDRALAVQVGGQARLRPRSGGERLHGRVIALGPIVDELPPRCWRNPRRPAWGRDVVILVEEPAPLVPGQAFDVELLPPPDVVAAARIEDREAQDGPRVMTVPAALKARTRVEPSGLAWVPRLKRFVVVSDDTGFEDDHEHAPWLLAMDSLGALDPRPIEVAGIERWSDLESIAPAPDGGLYVLSSQAPSKKGKRGEHRQVFAKLRADGGGFAVAGWVALAEALEADPAYATSLGLANVRELEIEGMTARGGELLLGLKAPLDAAKRARIWRLADPARLAAGGTPKDAGLAPFATVALTVDTDAGPVPGGIAELLALPDGRLVIAATAATGDPKRQDGALFVAELGEGELKARKVQEFRGLKPEGLALSPTPGRLVVVFDEGKGAPLWFERSWPPR